MKVLRSMFITIGIVVVAVAVGFFQTLTEVPQAYAADDAIEVMTVTATQGWCTNTSRTLLAANPGRKWVRLENLSTNEIYLAFGTNAAVVNAGVHLSAKSTSSRNAIWESARPTLIRQAITAIASTSDSNLVAVAEGK